MIIHRKKPAFHSFFLDNEKRPQLQFIYLEFILGMIGAVMSVINIFTHKHGLLISTSAMAVLSFANALLVSRDEKFMMLGKIIFSIKMFALFTYFIVFGGTEGFSTIWLLLLPACGMFAFGRKAGALLSLTLFVELAAFFYTPLRQSVLQCYYTESFLMRFPVVYCCFFAMGYFLEYVREITYNEMTRLRNEAKEQAQRDSLTGLFNRFGFDKKLTYHVKKANEGVPFALLFIDMDNFKGINDRYGHKVGDHVLRKSAERIKSLIQANDVACRWGGDEFAVIIGAEHYDEWKAIAKEICAALSTPIEADGFPVDLTISIGGVGSKEFSLPTTLDMSAIADRRLYHAKSRGRNRFVGRDE